jgi:hypothetical protein
MEKNITLYRHDELRCPRCDGSNGLTVNAVQIHLPIDELCFTFNTDPLRLFDIDAGGDHPTYTTLFVNCPNCSPKGDKFYLSLQDGLVGFDDDDTKAIRAHWSTDGGDGR